MKKCFFIIALFSSVFSSCEKDINLDIPKEKPRLGVHALWGKDSLLTVAVSRTFNITETPNVAYPEKALKKYGVLNAKVSVYKDGMLYENLVFDTQEYIYKTASSKKAVPGASYNIKVSAPDFNEVASPILTHLEQVNIKKVEVFRDVASDETGNLLSEVIIEFDDPGTEKNFYWITVNKPNNELYYFSKLVYPIDPDIIVPAGFVTSITTVPADNIILKDDAFNGQTKQVKFRVISRPAGMGLVVTLGNINEDVFKYKKSRLLVEDNSNPFSTPVQAFSNITDGLGIFGLFANDKRVVY